MTWTLAQTGTSVSGPTLVSLPSGTVLMNGFLTGMLSDSTLLTSFRSGRGHPDAGLVRRTARRHDERDHRRRLDSGRIVGGDVEQLHGAVSSRGSDADATEVGDRAVKFLPSCVIALASFAVLGAQTVDPSRYSELRWRHIGPFRGGRTVGASGVVQQPNVFYIGVNNGGVWKTTDYGLTWNPIFDDQPTQSIGAIAVAPSDPNIVYVASGEGCSGRTSRSATASTNPPTQARHGNTWASARPGRSVRC